LSPLRGGAFVGASGAVVNGGSMHVPAVEAHRRWPMRSAAFDVLHTSLLRRTASFNRLSRLVFLWSDSLMQRRFDNADAAARGARTR
jgi:hypothetical protein